MEDRRDRRCALAREPSTPPTVGHMDFAPSARAADLTARVTGFMATEITPIETSCQRGLR